jgi:hypothetical protein
MADWREEDREQEPWPVRYPVGTPPCEASKRFPERRPARWSGMVKVGSGELQRRLLWLLFAVEVGMVIAAACVLPLAFVDLLVGEEGIVGEILSKMETWLGTSRQGVCLILGLPCPILLLVIGLNLGLYYWLRGRRNGQ